MRCSVTSALRLDSEDFENAWIAAAANNKALPEIMEREREKRKKNGG